MAAKEFVTRLEFNSICVQSIGQIIGGVDDPARKTKPGGGRERQMNMQRECKQDQPQHGDGGRIQGEHIGPQPPGRARLLPDGDRIGNQRHALMLVDASLSMHLRQMPYSKSPVRPIMMKARECCSNLFA